MNKSNIHLIHTYNDSAIAGECMQAIQDVCNQYMVFSGVKSEIPCGVYTLYNNGVSADTLNLSLHQWITDFWHSRHL